MKKFILLFISVFFIFTNSMIVAADVSSYTVYSIKMDGTKTQIGEVTTDYEVAKKLMNEYDNKITDTAVIYKNDKLVNAYYGVVSLNSEVLNIYEDSSLKNRFTYTHGYYGKDAAFIDYDTSNDTYKIKISGYSGWISSTSATLVPISTIATNYIMIEQENTQLYTSNSNGSVIRTLQYKGSYIYVEKTLVGEETWYHITEENTNGWVKGNSVKEEVRPFYNTFYLRFNMENNNKPWDLYHYYEYGNNKQYNYLDLGIAPSFLTKNQYYYSFDGNYFYDDFIKMLDDYKIGNYENSVNKDKPYFNYYLYLPNHSLSSYSASDFDSFISTNYSAKPDSSYVDSSGRFTKALEQHLSQLYNEGASYVEAQNEYGINALLTFGVSKNESGDGRSAIAIAKNNLFGHGAYDSSPFESATAYETVKDSIIEHATKYMDVYINPNNIYYYGGHYGNKGSGMGVSYASDPYWGEKMAAHAYKTDISIVRRTYNNKLENESVIVGQDYLANTIGIKLTDKIVEVKKSPSVDSETVYLLKNNYYNKKVYNIPLIVVDKVFDNDKAWYKVRTDIALDENQNVTDIYNFDTSYGYVLCDDLYVSNNQPEITANDFKIDQGSIEDLLKNITATDLEDGDITNNITYNTTLDSNRVGDYDITYTVTDSMGFSSSKTVKITVIATSTPIINASDKTVKQYIEFNLLENVTAFDSIDGDITNKLQLIDSNLNINEVGTYQLTYSVTNSLNVTTTKTINVEVLSNSKPIIYASDIYVSKDSEISFKENVQARDLEDGILDVVIESNTTDLTKVDTYDLVYSVIDKDGNKVTKNIKVYVEDAYEKLKGEFYFDTLKWNNDTNLLDITGSLALIGIDNTLETNIKYDLILKNNNTSYEIVLPLERYLENHPETVYSDSSKKYIETWFKGSVSLSSVPKGEYTLYIRAISDKYQAKELVSNIFLKQYTKKATDKDGRGYLFRNNNYKREFPLELIITNNGLITKVESTHSSNMFNTVDSIVISDKYLNIIGNSFNMGGDYNKDKNINRNLILENIETEKQYVYSISSIVGNELSLKGDDGLSKARSWFDTTNLIDISTLEVGKYIIYLRTAVDSIDDYGELQDILLKVNQSVNLNGKTYILETNKNARYRIELIVKDIYIKY